MKKLFILILILCSLTACSQTVTQYIGTKTNTVLTQGSHKVDSIFYLPKVAHRTPTWEGAFRYYPPTQKGQLWNGTSWEDIATGATGTNKVDSVTFVSSSTVDTVKYWINGTATTAGYIDRKEGLISGGVVSWASGLTFDVTAAVYHLQGVRYTSAAGSITLNAADATHPRIDVIALNTSGQIVKITGTPAASPAEPQIDPATQVFLTSVHVAATATTPTGVSRLLVYDENTEWTGGTTGTVSANFNGTTPSSGSKSTTLSSWSNGAAVHYTGTAQTPGSYTTLKLRVRLSGPLSSNQNISVVFVNGTTTVSNAVNLTAYGFMKTLLSDYQTISIPMSGFAFSGTSFDRVQLNLSGNASSTVNIDVIELQGGITQTSPTYTDAQARKAISLTTTGTSGAATYNNTTGVLNIPQYAGQQALIDTAAALRTAIGSGGSTPGTRVLKRFGALSTLANSSTTLIYAYTLPGGTLAAAGDRLYIKVWFKTSGGGADNINVTLRAGTTTLVGRAATSFNANGNEMEFEIVRLANNTYASKSVLQTHTGFPSVTFGSTTSVDIDFDGSEALSIEFITGATTTIVPQMCQYILYKE
jgi:hypothetical protein